MPHQSPSADRQALPVGKLPPELLARLLAFAGRRDPRVVQGASVGEDGAAISMAGGPGLLVAAADPITFAAERIGWYAVHVNANDIAAMGATPRWFLATLLLPEGTSATAVEAIMADIHAACTALEIALVGGHTEVTHALPRPLISGCMLGEVAPDRLVTTGGARPGDVVLLLGSAGVEGTAVLAQEAAQRLAEAGLSQDELDRARTFLDDPGISVVGASRALCAVTRPSALHDVTEGGIAGGLRELAGASGVGLRVEAGRVPVAPLTARICAALALHPWGLLGSGALLATVAAAEAEKVIAALRRRGVACAAIGICTDHRDLIVLDDEGRESGLPAFARDEVARYLG